MAKIVVCLVVIFMLASPRFELSAQEIEEIPSPEEETVPVPTPTTEGETLPPEELIPPAEEAKPPEEKPRTLKVYTVKEGDTLWDIASNWYQDGFSWQKIWNYNKYVKNPHWIFPGDDLIVPVYTGAKEEEEIPLTEEPAEVSRPLEEALPPIMIEETFPIIQKVQEDTFIAPLDISFDGQLTEMKERKFMISQGDIAFINLGKNLGVTPGMKFLVYRKGRIVVDPETEEKLGVVVKRVGVIKATHKIREKTTTVEIIRSYVPLKIGDLVKIWEEE